MRRVSKVLTVLTLLGVVTAFAPSFFPTNTVGATAGPHDWTYVGEVK